MTMTKRILSLCLLVFLLTGALVSCKQDPSVEEPEIHDFASELKLDMSSTTKKTEVTVKAYIDGDTTHFNATSEFPGNVLKARYLAINTPESTGKVEEWGKAASNFTKETLMNADKIMVESDNDVWNVDSTGGRYLVWVWYIPKGESEYRNLNVEILQNGLAIASNSAQNRYGETCMAAINQAKTQSLKVHSNEKDPNFPYGEAQEITLRELRSNIAEYDGTKVAFEGVVSKNSQNTVYVEEYDSETDTYYGMTVYYGYSLNGTGLQILNVGNRVRIVGTVQYYETGKSYQVSGLEYSPMRPNDPNNIKLISEGNSAAYKEITAETFKNGKITVTLGDDTEKVLSFGEASIATSVSMKNLKVVSIYTTTNEESSSNGAMTLTCEVDGITIPVRTIVLKDQDGKTVTADAFKDKTIDVKGLIDCFDGEYQIKVFSLTDIVIK